MPHLDAHNLSQASNEPHETQGNIEIESELYTADEKLREQERIKFLFDRLDLYRDMMARPYVTGKDLIDRGIMPGDDFGTILEYAHKLRLAGVSKDDALKQTLSYARKLRKNIK